MIKVENLKRHYQLGETLVKALDGVSFELKEGEYTAIVGPSGSGKSTLMNLLGILDRPSGGTYTLRGQEVQNLKPGTLAQVRNREIGFVFQSFHLLGRVSALDNVELPLVYRRIPKKERQRLAQKALAQVGLEGREHHHPNQLSGGQRQRVAIARALVGHPTLLLADEPTGALDSHTGQEILELFDQLNSQGRTVVVITHDPTVARRSRRVIQLMDGKILYDGPSQEWQS